MRVVDQHQRFRHWRADVIGEFQRRCARTAFAAIDNNEVGTNTSRQHCFGNRKPLPRMTDRQLESGRFATRQLTHLCDKSEQFFRRGKRTVC